MLRCGELFARHSLPASESDQSDRSKPGAYLGGVLFEVRHHRPDDESAQVLADRLASVPLRHAEAAGGIHAWISSHLAGDLSVPVLAAEAGMSERSFGHHYQARFSS
jgi:hypothetical protein